MKFFIRIFKSDDKYSIWSLVQVIKPLNISCKNVISVIEKYIWKKLQPLLIAHEIFFKNWKI